MLLEYKKKNKMSYDKLQELTNIDRQNIYRTIKDLTTPKIDTYGKICIALNMTDEEIGKEIRKFVLSNKKEDN